MAEDGWRWLKMAEDEQAEDGQELKVKCLMNPANDVRQLPERLCPQA